MRLAESYFLFCHYVSVELFLDYSASGTRGVQRILPLVAESQERLATEPLLRPPRRREIILKKCPQTFFLPYNYGCAKNEQKQIKTTSETGGLHKP